MRIAGASDRGATIVEAAFAIPIFLFLLLGLVDFGTLVLENNKATNAARDGARVGLVDYIDAENDGNPAVDGDGSANYEAIKVAIESKLPDRSLSDSELDVECISPAGTVKPCTRLDIKLDEDRIRVVVRWDREAISPVAPLLGFGTVEVSGEARMTIAGRPIAGSGGTPPDCTPDPSNPISVDPPTVQRTSSGELSEDLEVTVNGTGTCINETLHLVDPIGPNEVQICNTSCLGTTTYVGSTNSFWDAGTARVELRSNGGTVVEASAPFQIVDPPECRVTAVTPTQATIGRTSTNLLATNVGFTLTGASTCTNLTMTLTAPGSNISRQICTNQVCTSGTYFAAGDPIWTATGPATITVTGDSPTFTNASVFQVVNACAPTVSVTPNPASASQQRNSLSGSGVDITLTPNSGANCSDYTVSILASNGVSVFNDVCPGVCGLVSNFKGNTSQGVWTASASSAPAFVRVVDNLTGVTTQTPFTVS